FAPPAWPGQAAPTEAVRNGGSARKGGRRYLLIGAALAAVALVGASAAVLLFGEDGPPKSRQVYFADFEGKNDTWTEGSSHEATLGGAFRLETWAHDGLSYEEIGPKTPPDAQLINATIRPISGPGYGEAGLFCAYTAGTAGGSYTFYLRADGEGILVRKSVGDAVKKNLAEKNSTPGFKKGKDNKLTVLCQRLEGKIVLKAWVNGRLALDVTDAEAPLVPPGESGIEARNLNGGTTRAEFDDFEIRELT
ncbi:hypothetical protein, partial [Actinocorallia lasiicapitis]